MEDKRNNFDKKMAKPESDTFLRNKDPYLREVHTAIYGTPWPGIKDKEFCKAAEDYALAGVITMEDAFKPTKEELEEFQHVGCDTLGYNNSAEDCGSAGSSCEISDNEATTYLPVSVMTEVTTKVQMKNPDAVERETLIGNHVKMNKIWIAGGVSVMPENGSPKL